MLPGESMNASHITGCGSRLLCLWSPAVLWVKTCARYRGEGLQLPLLRIWNIFYKWLDQHLIIPFDEALPRTDKPCMIRRKAQESSLTPECRKKYDTSEDRRRSRGGGTATSSRRHLVSQELLPQCGYWQMFSAEPAAFWIPLLVYFSFLDTSQRRKTSCLDTRGIPSCPHASYTPCSCWQTAFAHLALLAWPSVHKASVFALSLIQLPLPGSWQVSSFL